MGYYKKLGENCQSTRKAQVQSLAQKQNKKHIVVNKLVSNSF